MALKHAFSTLVVKTTDHKINNFFKDYFFNKIDESKLKVLEGSDDFDNKKELILTIGDEYVKHTSQGMVSFFGWSDVKDRVFEIANPFKALWSDVKLVRSKPEKEETLKNFVKETYKNLATTILESILTPFYAIAYVVNAMYTRPYGKKSSFTNFVKGLLFFLGNVVSAALVTVLSLAQNALSIVKDVFYGTAGLLIQPVMVKLREYTAAEKVELKGEELEAANKAEAEAKKAKVEMLEAMEKVALDQLPEYLKANAEIEFSDLKVKEAPVEPKDNKYLKGGELVALENGASDENIALHKIAQDYIKERDAFNAKPTEETVNKALEDADKALKEAKDKAAESNDISFKGAEASVKEKDANGKDLTADAIKAAKALVGAYNNAVQAQADAKKEKNDFNFDKAKFKGEMKVHDRDAKVVSMFGNQVDGETRFEITAQATPAK